MPVEVTGQPPLPGGVTAGDYTIAFRPAGGTVTPYKQMLSALGGATPGPAGPGFSGASINSSGHLVLTKTDGTAVDVGAVVGSGGSGGAGNLLYRGAWALNTTYAVNDLVRYLGQMFLCATAHTSASAFDGSMFAAWRSNFGKAFHPEDYGAKCDGATDDSAAWTTMMASVRAAGSSVILLSAGASLVQGGIIGLPDSSSIIGQGVVSEIRWFGNDTQQTGTWLIDMSGSGQNTPAGYHTLSNFKISGNAAGGKGYLIRAYYNAHSVIDTLYADSAAYGLFDFVQPWDMRITKIQGNFIGTHPDSAAMWFRNSSATSGNFGHSDDTANQVFISHVRLEDSFGNDLRIEIGTGSNTNYPPNGFYVHDFKGESNHRLSRSSVYIGPSVTVSSFTDFYCTSNHFSPYYGSDQYKSHYAIENHGGGRNYFGQIRAEQGDNGLLIAAMLQAASGQDHLEDVSFEAQQGQGPTSGNLIVIPQGSAQPFFTGLFTCSPSVSRLVSGITSKIRAGALEPDGMATLTDAATIATDVSQADLFAVTLAGNRALANPTNLLPGVFYTWQITQDGTGNRTLTFGNLFTWPGGVAPSLSTAAGAVDVISAFYDGSKLRATLGKAFA